MDKVDVMVIDPGGGMPVTGRLELCTMPAGRGQRLAFVCPKCRGGKYMLLARNGELRCRACLRHRTRRQTERTMADYVRRGGKEEDALLRLFQSARRITSRKLAQARELAMALVAADRARVEDLRGRLDDLRTYVESR
jgi:hypothetical protein